MNNNIRRRCCYVAVAVGLAMVLSACGSGSGDSNSETITLKVADSLPTEHVFSKDGIVPWMDEIEEKTDHRVEFEHYPAGQLGAGAELLSAVQDGLTDISYIVPSYVSTALPLSTIGALPGYYDSSPEATIPYWKLITGKLKSEFERQKVRPVMATVAPKYQLMIGSGTIHNLSDVKGKKLRSPGGVQDLAIEALGASSVSMSADEVFTSMQRGTVDGTILPLASISGYGIAELLTSVTSNAPLGGTMPIMVMSEKAWNELPKDVQEVFEEVAPKAGKRAAEAWQIEGEDLLSKLKESGVEITELADSELKEWNAALAGVSDRWVKAREKDGKPAEAALKEWKRLLQESTSD